MAEEYKGESSYENISDDGGGHRERGIISRKNLNRAVRAIIPKRFKSSEEHFNNIWDAIYKPLANGEEPNSLQVGTRLLKRNARKLASTVAEGASKIADAVPKTTASLSRQDPSSLRTLVDAQERQGLLASEDSIEADSDKKATRQMRRVLDTRSREASR